MTDASTQNTLTEVLVRHGIYNHNGVFRIAIMDNTLQDLAGTDTFQVQPGDVTLVEAPGSEDWITSMVRIRSNLNRRADSAENDLRVKNEYIETLGQALLEEAERRDWCSEYDEFAREWDLPTRARDYEVTMTVTVQARDEDEAQTLVRDQVSLSSYSGHDWLVDGPGYSADTVY